MKRVLFVEDQFTWSDRDHQLWAKIFDVPKEEVEMIHVLGIPTLEELKKIDGFDWDNQVVGGEVAKWMKYLHDTNQDGYFGLFENKTHLIHSSSLQGKYDIYNILKARGVERVNTLDIMSRLYYLQDPEASLFSN